MVDEAQEEPKLVESPPAPTEPAPAPTDAARGRARERLGWLLLLLLVVVVLAGSSPFWATRVASLLPWAPPAASGKDELTAALAPFDQRLDDVARQQAALDRRAGELEEQLRRASAATASLKAMEERVAAIEERPRGAERAEVAALQTQVQSLQQSAAQNGERIGKLEARPNAGAERSDAALLLAIGQLRARVETSQPFAAELGAVTALGRHDKRIDAAAAPLADAAAKGIPSLAVLTQRFGQEVVPAVLHAQAAPAGEGWGDWILGKLRHLVTIRPVGQTATEAHDPTDAALARTEAVLAAGDLAGAVAAAENLPAHALEAAPAQAWLTEARRRLAAEQAVASLTEDVTARLAETDRGDAKGER